MKRSKRIRFEMQAACRTNSTGTTARHDDFQIIRNKYDLSTAGFGGTHARAIFVGPGKATS